MDKPVHSHRFRLRLTRGQTAAFMSGVFLCALATSTSTESVTLTTYYASPAGVYNNLLSIGNTWLARDNIPVTGTPSFVEIGNNQADSRVKVDIFGQDNGVGDDIRVHGGLASPNQYGVLNVNDMGQYVRLGYSNGTSMGSIFLDGNVGIGATNPPNNLTATNTIASQKNCMTVDYPIGGGWTPCPGGTYATYFSGFYSNYQANSTWEYGAYTYASGFTGNGFMLCCPP